VSIGIVIVSLGIVIATIAFMMRQGLPVLLQTVTSTARGKGCLGFALHVLLLCTGIQVRNYWSVPVIATCDLRPCDSNLQSRQYTDGVIPHSCFLLLINN
jgi:hypothetical protein